MTPHDSLTWVKTLDNSMTCFSDEVGEHYHSKFGALTEAWSMYIEPTLNHPEFAELETLTMLDPFLGLGYNSLALIKAILTAKQQGSSQLSKLKHLRILAVEYDPDILTSIPHTIEALNFDAIDPTYPHAMQALFEHKIYYQTLVDHIETAKTPVVPLFQDSTFCQRFETPQLTIDVVNLVGDLRQMLPLLLETDAVASVDVLFHDAFSPGKQPELWSQSVFAHYRPLFKPHGLFLTYSAAASVREGLAQNGFHLYLLHCTKIKPGTMGSLTPLSTYEPLPEMHQALMKTKSGLPYVDNETLSLTREELLAQRAERQQQSDLPGSSRVHATFKQRFYET